MYIPKVVYGEVREAVEAGMGLDKVFYTGSSLVANGGLREPGEHDFPMNQEKWDTFFKQKYVDFGRKAYAKWLGVSEELVEPPVQPDQPEALVAAPVTAPDKPDFADWSSELQDRPEPVRPAIAPAGVDDVSQPAPARPSDPKETNPKAAIGVRKVSLSVVPMDVVLEASLGMLEGAAKYGKANYLASGARASVYYDGTMRHLNQWWLGENIDADSGLHHISKAISSLMVLRSCMLAEKFTDDRPPLIGFDIHQLNDVAACILEKHKDKNPRHYTIQDEV